MAVVPLHSFTPFRRAPPQAFSLHPPVMPLRVLLAIPRIRYRCFLCSCTTVRPVACGASRNDGIETARKIQSNATDLLAQLLKAQDAELFARENAQSLTQEFFMIASTYLSMAKKEGNAEVVNQLETTLKIAMQEREKILRPEIQLLNQLLRNEGTAERAKTMEKFIDYLKSDSYFFQLLNQMVLDVEKQPSNPDQMKLLSQLRVIKKEARDASKRLKHATKD